MKLSSVLTSIKGSNEKTASAAPQQPQTAEKSATAVTGERLKQALKEATAPAAAPAQEKQAAATGSPVEGLTKIAEQVANAEHEALVKEAKLYGASVFDGFIERAAQYEAAGIKVAALAPTAPATAPAQVKQASEGGFEKFAAENPDLIKEAAELGFSSTMSQVEKLAEAAYAKGYDEGTLTVYKLGHATFVQGFEDTANLLKAVQK